MPEAGKSLLGWIFPLIEKLHKSDFNSEKIPQQKSNSKA